MAQTTTQQDSASAQAPAASVDGLNAQKAANDSTVVDKQAASQPPTASNEVLEISDSNEGGNVDVFTHAHDKSTMVRVDEIGTLAESRLLLIVLILSALIF